jgi:hypothetical protein
MHSAQPNACLAISADRRINVTSCRVIPTTIMVKAAETKVVRPDILTLDGRSAGVITAGVLLNKFQPGPPPVIDQKDPKCIIIRNGLPGNTTRTIEYLVKGSAPVTVQYSALKGEGPDGGRPAIAHVEKKPRTAIRRYSAPGCIGPAQKRQRPGGSPRISVVIVGASPSAPLRRRAT